MEYIVSLKFGKECEDHRAFLSESFQDFVQDFEQNSQQTVSLDGITLISLSWLVPSPVEQQVGMTCLQKMDQFLELFVYSVFIQITIQLLAVVQVKWSLVWVGCHLFYALIHSREESAPRTHLIRFLKGRIITVSFADFWARGLKCLHNYFSCYGLYCVLRLVIYIMLLTNASPINLIRKRLIKIP